MISVSKGEIVTCPNCEKHLAIVTYNIHIGDIIMASLFDAIPPQTIKDGEKCESHCCGVPWSGQFGSGASGFQIHTQKGWLP